MLHRGIDVSILVHTDVLAELGAGGQISPNGTRVLDAGYLEDVVRVSSEPDAKESRL